MASDRGDSGAAASAGASAEETLTHATSPAMATRRLP
jgi:hypothetical protein